nr:hypothetical protein [uncultured bacterium]
MIFGNDIQEGIIEVSKAGFYFYLGVLDVDFLGLGGCGFDDLGH